MSSTKYLGGPIVLWTVERYNVMTLLQSSVISCDVCGILRILNFLRNLKNVIFSPNITCLIHFGIRQLLRFKKKVVQKLYFFQYDIVFVHCSFYKL